MKDLLKKIGLIFGLFVGIMMGGQTVQAAASQQNSDFEIQPILSENQVNADVNFFDLSLGKGKTEKIKVRIQNFSDKTIEVQTEIRNAQTQIGGDFKFVGAKGRIDQTLKVPLTELVKLDTGMHTIKLAPQEAKVISATATMPTDGFRGLIYGDWHFVEHLKTNKTADSSITSNYAYSVGMALHGKPYQVYPELKYVTTKPILYARHAAMGVDLRNNQPMAITAVAAKATLKKDGLFASKHVVDIKGKVIAPNSILTLPLSWDYNRLKPGTYTVDVTVKGQNYWNKLPMTWHFKKHLTVSKKAVAKINNQAIKKPVNSWAYVATASGVLMVTILGLLFYSFKYRP